MLRQSTCAAGLLGSAVLLALSAAALPAGDAADAPMQHQYDSALGGANARIVQTNYTIPPLQLVRASGQRVSLDKEVNDGRPVLLNFIFTTCETTCPLSSATFARFQKELGAERAKVHMMSISIDPEQDTPARLRDYANKFGAGPEWQFYTGTLQASVAAQQSFGVYYGDKMSHTPVTLLRPAPGKPWTRIDGFVTPEQLVQKYHALLSEP